MKEYKKLTFTFQGVTYTLENVTIVDGEPQTYDYPGSPPEIDVIEKASTEAGVLTENEIDEMLEDNEFYDSILLAAEAQDYDLYEKAQIAKGEF